MKYHLKKEEVHTCSREIIDIFPRLKFIALLGVYIAVLVLMTLTLPQGHRCVRNINCKLRVLDSCPL